ncbi:DUF6188 family protein [Nocardia sp. NPDC050717]|uniref:DUF6188 family protein n=1 Tax=Nocardia sp. NPDC050717 TaxID=3157221 RepID=UPI0033D56CAC
MDLQLEIIGKPISEVELGFTATIRIGSPIEYELQVEGEISVRTAEGRLVSAPSNSYVEIRGELESIVGSKVVRADASEVDGLSIELSSGAVLNVPVDEHYEAWGIVGLNGYRVICLPGGELAIWSAREGKSS